MIRINIISGTSVRKNVGWKINKHDLERRKKKDLVTSKITKFNEFLGTATWNMIVRKMSFTFSCLAVLFYESLS